MEQLMAGLDQEAMEVRAQDAARRASQARNRADAALRRNIAGT